jgi:hypothetical protein
MVADRDLQAAHFDGFLAPSRRGHVGHHVLVGADTRGQNLRDVGVGQGRETPVDAAGRRGGPLALTSPRALTKAKTRSLLYIRIFCSRRAERRRRPWRRGWQNPGRRWPKRCPGRRARYGCSSRSERRLRELLDDRGAVLVGGAEDVEAALLVLFDDHPWRFPVWGRADDGGKPGRRAVHELHAAFSQDGVVGRPSQILPASMSGSSVGR